jgi:hypothetical protein
MLDTEVYGDSRDPRRPEDSAEIEPGGLRGVDDDQDRPAVLDDLLEDVGRPMVELAQGEAAHRGEEEPDRRVAEDEDREDAQHPLEAADADDAVDDLLQGLGGVSVHRGELGGA